MRTLNIRGALFFSVTFLMLAWLGSVYFPSDTDVHFSVESGFYDEPVTLEMTCAVPGAEIYYTTDGSMPTIQSYYYDGPLTLENVEGEYHVLSDYTGVSEEDYLPETSMMKANVVRAVAFWDENGTSAVTSGTFFVGVDREGTYGNVPIVSLMVEEEDLFDYETGIYTLGAVYDDWYASLENKEDYEWYEIIANFSYRGREWERPVYVDYFPADGHVGFAQNMGIRIKGGATRNFNQKSFRLTARNEYGSNRVQYALFGVNPQADGNGLVQDYKQFVLRNGGNDCSYAKIREPLIQNLAQGMRFDTMSSQPCVVFINGEYWGLYSLTEEYGDHYIEANYQIQRENVVIVKRFMVEAGQEEDFGLLEKMMTFILENDMSDSENYGKAAEMMDMGNFADFFALQLYVGNADGAATVNNNWQLWRARTLDSSNHYADTRWRMMLYDVDCAADLLGSGWGYDEDHLTPVLLEEENASYWAGVLRSLNQNDQFLWEFLLKEENASCWAGVLRSLYHNDQFRRELVTALCDVRNIHFSTERFANEMAALRAVYEPLMPDSIYRFGPQSVVDWGAEEHCAKELDKLEIFFEGRWEVFPQIVQQALGLQPPATASISRTGDGGVMVNHSVPDLQNGYAGLYFPDYPITLTALENGEGRFVCWEGEGCEIADPYAMSTEVSFETDFSVRAVFE